jgi:hypothetical protein
MVYKTQNYWAFGLCPLSAILKTRRQRFGNFICFSPELMETPIVLDPLERANLNHWTTHIRIVGFVEWRELENMQ